IESFHHRGVAHTQNDMVETKEGKGKFGCHSPILYRNPAGSLHSVAPRPSRRTIWGCGTARSDVRAFHMSWRGDSGDKERRGYHHGNLREALIRAAVDLIAAKGPAGFTFAEAARSAGVSPAAPYRHFRDRDALMADVARRGFELFEAELGRAWNDGRPDPM